MGTTFSTDQECFTAFTLTDVTVSTTTRPSSGAITLYRDKAKAKIVRIIGSAADSNNIAKDIEIELVCRMLENRMNGTRLSEELTDEQITKLQMVFDMMPCGTYEPNQDGNITG